MPALLVITKVESQKNRPHRKSVYLDGKFAFGADEELIREFELEEEKKLSQRELKQILWSVDRSKLKERAIRLLSIRPRSEKELKEKLRQKGAGVRLIEEVVRGLKEKYLLDAEKFAYSWAESRD